MATKKSVAKKTAVPAKKTVAKSAPVKAPAAVKAPMLKMTKTQVIRKMAEQLEVSPKQIGTFFDLLMRSRQLRHGRPVSLRFLVWASS